MNPRLLLSLAVGLALLGEVNAQQYVYPAKGQTPQQQKSDEAACYSWAVQQTGFDPAKPPQQAATKSGPTAGAGARGAARGAVVGEVVGGDAGAGAAAGAVAARSQSRRENKAAAQQAQSGTQEQQAAFGKARAACLEGKGYTVK
ncbi:MAG TPA: hypothetical protein VLQ46_00240 [Casimicrobiaceae bacterium]|nr:hypothetical protein [Casimicrobiaceae bacterium]